MSFLQGALPDARLSSSFFGSVSEPWLTQSSASPYIPVVDEGMFSCWRSIMVTDLFEAVCLRIRCGLEHQLDF